MQQIQYKLKKYFEFNQLQTAEQIQNMVLVNQAMKPKFAKILNAFQLIVRPSPLKHNHSQNHQRPKYNSPYLCFISCPVEYLHFRERKAEGRRQKRCDPASAKDAPSSAPREAEGKKEVSR